MRVLPLQRPMPENESLESGLEPERNCALGRSSKEYTMLAYGIVKQAFRGDRAFALLCRPMCKGRKGRDLVLRKREKSAHAMEIDLRVGLHMKKSSHQQTVIAGLTLCFDSFAQVAFPFPPTNIFGVPF